MNFVIGRFSIFVIIGISGCVGLIKWLIRMVNMLCWCNVCLVLLSNVLFFFRND